MKFRYISTMLNQGAGSYVDMHLYSVIGGEKGINAQMFVDELNYLANYTDVEEVRVRINSEGGDVIAGVGIFSAIVNANKAGKITVNTFNDGVCASIAGVILLAGKNRYAKPFGRSMIHGVRLEDESKATENDKAGLETFKNMLNEIFTGSTFKSKSYFENLLTNGKDNWFNAKDALKAGIITAIESDEHEEEVASIVNACGNDAEKIRTQISTYLNQQSQNQPTMKKVLMKLGLDSSSNEDQAEAKAGELISANEKLTREAKEKDDRITELQGQLDTANAGVAEEVVNGAINSGKFNKEKKAELLATAKKDLPGFKNMLAAMNVTAPNMKNQLTPGTGGEASEELKEKIKGKTLRDIEKMKGGEAIINELKTTDKKAYVNLYNAQYKTNYKEDEI